jgi:hypothetical protein
MRKPRGWLWALVSAAFGLLLLLGWLLWSAPRHPIALIRVVDATGKPVVGAVIRPEGLRTKPGPYVSGWYGWMTGKDGVPNQPVSTDANGYARVPYPKYVFERIETGTIICSFSHPDFVPDRPERVVATTPPAGAPWRVWADDLWGRLQHKVLIARVDPIVLQKGATLRLSVRPDCAAPKGLPLFAQISAGGDQETNFWIRPEPGVLVTRRLAAGLQTVRAVQVETNGAVWFSDVISITAVAGQTNELVVDLKRGVAVHGQLDATVPRPVRNGRVVAHVWPKGLRPQDSPPQWHAWTTNREDGSFDFGSLPEGDLEIVVLCDGFVSTNGPGKFQMHYPQQHQLGTNDLAVRIGMEPTARLEVTVLDDKGNPLKDAHVATWPNVRYGEWSATMLVGDRYNTAEQLMPQPASKFDFWSRKVPDFEGTTDSSGLAVIANLPKEVKEFNVEHAQFTLPAVVTPWGDKRREASVTLKLGQTNRVAVQLERSGRTPIAHY